MNGGLHNFLADVLASSYAGDTSLVQGIPNTWAKLKDNQTKPNLLQF